MLASRALALSGLITLSLLSSACVPAAIIGGGAATANAIAEERTGGAIMDDVGIKTRILNKLFQDDMDLFQKVEVDVVERRVFLTGSVKQPEMAVQAVQLTWQVPGVTEVVNEIQVEDKSRLGDMARDSWIETQIETKVLLEKGVRSANYTIEVVNNVVYIMGIAQNEAERRKVANIAARTKYVKQVISHVVLKNDARRGIYTGASDGATPQQSAPVYNSAPSSNYNSGSGNYDSGAGSYDSAPVSNDSVYDSSTANQYTPPDDMGTTGSYSNDSSSGTYSSPGSVGSSDLPPPASLPPSGSSY